MLTKHLLEVVVHYIYQTKCAKIPCFKDCHHQCAQTKDYILLQQKALSTAQQLSNWCTTEYKKEEKPKSRLERKWSLSQSCNEEKTEGKDCCKGGIHKKTYFQRQRLLSPSTSIELYGLWESLFKGIVRKGKKTPTSTGWTNTVHQHTSS